MTTTVTRNALIKRINRKLAKGDRRLVISRGWRERQNLGDYHVIDVGRNIVRDCRIDPTALARELGVMQASEHVAD